MEAWRQFKKPGGFAPSPKAWSLAGKPLPAQAGNCVAAVCDRRGFERFRWPTALTERRYRALAEIAVKVAMNGYTFQKLVFGDGGRAWQPCRKNFESKRASRCFSFMNRRNQTLQL
jgi:hypothetical protein